MKIPGAAGVSEGGLETLIVTAMAGKATTTPTTDSVSGEAGATYDGTGWALGRAQHYNHEYAVDPAS